MASMRDIVASAALRLRLVGGGETLEAADAADMLQALNDMMGSWEGRGVVINWSGDLTLNDEFPIADKHIAGVKAMLARRFANESGKPVTPQLEKDAIDGWNAIAADYLLPDMLRVDRALAFMPSQRRIR